MVSDNGHEERMPRLRSEAERSLRSFLDQPVTPVASVGRQDEAGRRIPPTPAVLSIHVDLSGGAVFLDDERRVRALAKEIKRLISEDARRGLSI